MSNNYDIKDRLPPKEDPKKILEKEMSGIVTNPGELTEEDRVLYLQFKNGPVDTEALLRRRESANQSQRELIEYIIQSIRERDLT